MGETAETLTSGVTAALGGGGALPDCMLEDSLATSALTDAVRSMAPNRMPKGSSQNCSRCKHRMLVREG